MTQVQVTCMKKLKHFFNLLMWGCWASCSKDRNLVCSCKHLFKTNYNPTKLSFSKANVQLWCLILGIEIQFMVVNVHLKHKLCSSMVGLIYILKVECLSCHFIDGNWYHIWQHTWNMIFQQDWAFSSHRVTVLFVVVKYCILLFFFYLWVLSVNSCFRRYVTFHNGSVSPTVHFSWIRIGLQREIWNRFVISDCPDAH